MNTISEKGTRKISHSDKATTPEQTTNAEIVEEFDQQTTDKHSMQLLRNAASAAY